MDIARALAVLLLAFGMAYIVVWTSTKKVEMVNAQSTRVTRGDIGSSSSFSLIGRIRENVSLTSGRYPSGAAVLWREQAINRCIFGHQSIYCLLNERNSNSCLRRAARRGPFHATFPLFCIGSIEHKFHLSPSPREEGGYGNGKGGAGAGHVSFGNTRSPYRLALYVVRKCLSYRYFGAQPCSGRHSYRPVSLKFWFNLQRYNVQDTAT